MINSARIKELLSLRGKSQAAMARAIGVSPQAVSKIVNGDTAESPKLYLIARFLRTTPEYITNESDDPDSDGSDDSLTYEEQELLDLFRGLEKGEQGAIITLARSIATSARAPTVHAPVREYRAVQSVGSQGESPNPVLERALAEAMAGPLPRKPDAQARYLATVVQRLIALPEDLAASKDSVVTAGTAARNKAGPAPRATKRA